MPKGFKANSIKNIFNPNNLLNLRPQTTHGKIFLSLLIQLSLAPFLAHGYDFTVSLVAGRNVASGLSPYEGGAAPIDLGGYGSNIQGIGETPLWPLWLGAAYVLSHGDFYAFNLVSKLPIIAANIILAYVSHKKGKESWFNFFLFNPFLLLASSIWGKPDILTALLGALSLLTVNKPKVSALLSASSIMVKPLTLPIMIPILTYNYTKGWKTLSAYTLTVILTGATLFLAPFLILKWPISTTLLGLGNWFKPAGGLTLFNILELVYNTDHLPPHLEPLGLLPIISMLLVSAYCLVRPPRTTLSLATYALTASTIFLATRTWLSEQNILLLFPLLLLTNQRAPTRLLWLTPLLFMLVNTSLIQLTYPIYRSVNTLIASFDESWRTIRISAKFLMNIPWLYCLYTTVKQSLSRNQSGD